MGTNQEDSPQSIHRLVGNRRLHPTAEPISRKKPKDQHIYEARNLAIQHMRLHLVELLEVGRSLMPSSGCRNAAMCVRV